MTDEATSVATAAAGLDTWPGVLHRGLGWVGRWPGLVAVIPNDSAHDMAAEQLLRQLGAGVTADEARAAISAAALRGELRAAAYVAQPGDPSTLVGFACGVTEVIADGQVLINGTSPLQEVPLGAPEQLTVRAANLAAAARAISPYDLRLGVVPGAGITLAPVGSAIASDPSIAGTGSALPGGSVQTGPQSLPPASAPQPRPAQDPPRPRWARLRRRSRSPSPGRRPARPRPPAGPSPPAACPPRPRPRSARSWPCCWGRPRPAPRQMWPPFPR